MVSLLKLTENSQKEGEQLLKTEKYQIYMLLVFVMIAWGLNVIATKVIVTNFEPVTITSLRVFTAGISVFIILFFLKKLRRPSKTEILFIFFASLFNVVAHHYFLSIGLSKTTASNAGLILGLGPLLTAVVAFIFLGTKATIIRIIGILSGLTGVSFIVIEGNGSVSSISIGDAFVFISILAQAISFIMIRKVSNTLDPRLMTGYMLVIGSVILFVISLIQEPNGLQSIQHGSIGIWLIFLGSAVIATAIGHMTYNFAIGKVGVTESSIFINLNPFFALVSAVLFLGEKIYFSHVFGFIFILIGVLLGSGAMEDFIRGRRRRRDKKKPLPINQSI
jgi:drug/metabolite transporter (DMT)-like permease